MSLAQRPSPAKLVIGLFTATRDLIVPVAEALAERFGPPDLVSPWFAFDDTDYYRREMGGPLFRRMIAFSSLIDSEALVRIKEETNALESMWADAGARRVNIDPGYLVRSRFVLATGKDHTHRIHLGWGIFADLTLIYTGGKFQRLPWTYPDYGGPELRGFLEKVRRRYLTDLQRTAAAEKRKP